MNNNLSIDPITGMLSGTPAVLGNYTICLDIQEWRNGVMINVNRRELELNVVDCKAVLNAPPVTCTSKTVLFNHSNNSSLEYLCDFGVAEINTDSSTLIYPIYTYPTVTGEIPTCYTLKVWGKDSFCTSMDTVYIKYGNGPDIHVHTAFSPNGDGINDRLYLSAFQVQVTQIAIFNRWGQTVFSITNPNHYWDGTFFQGRLQVRDQ